ncbi:hypothetical protein [Alishewanella longhuensis]
MSESSFDRAFYITDPSSIKQLEYDLDNPKKVEYSKRDMAQENKKGIELIKESYKQNMVSLLLNQLRTNEPATKKRTLYVPARAESCGNPSDI